MFTKKQYKLTKGKILAFLDELKLIDESSIVRDMAQNFLRAVDEQRVRDALAAYDSFWNEYYRAETEQTASAEESIYYAQEIEKLKTYQPTKAELTEFLTEQFTAQNIPERTAQEFMFELELFKFEKQLKAQLDNGLISRDEYNRRLREEIRKFELEKLNLP